MNIILLPNEEKMIICKDLNEDNTGNEIHNLKEILC